jgi:hypothetical protein
VKLSGQWDPKMDRMMEMLFRIDDKIKAGVSSLQEGAVKTAVCNLYSNISAVSSAVVLMCKEPRPCSSQVVGCLLRTVLDACISVFAFCKGPADRASIFLDYAVVVRFKGQLRLESHLGCPLSRDVGKPVRARAKAEVRSQMLRVGLAYLSHKKVGQSDQDILEEALQPGKEHPSWFRDTWFPEKRKDVLAGEGMEWVDDVLYKWLCSPVHSDAWASQCLAEFERTHGAMLAVQFWGASAWRLTQVLGIELEPEEVKVLRDVYYSGLQWHRAEA